MKKETDLLSYLPEFIGEYAETAACLNAENPEFDIAWENAELILRNEFISTADEDGISRFEKLLKILPSSGDSLELRRARVLNKWLSKLPYTVKMLIKNLVNLCGGDDFVLKKKFDSYTVDITTHLRQYSQVEELRELLNEMIPANMTITSFNITNIKADGKAVVYAGLRLSGKHRKIRTEVKNYGLE